MVGIESLIEKSSLTQKESNKTMVQIMEKGFEAIQSLTSNLGISSSSTLQKNNGNGNEIDTSMENNDIETLKKIHLWEEQEIKLEREYNEINNKESNEINLMRKAYIKKQMEQILIRKSKLFDDLNGNN